ncbi:hypothetical protein ACOSQ2_003179 [Xanthoceras sorbifolium]
MPFMGTQNSSDLSSCRTNTLCFSGPSAFVLILLLKHILLRSISLFRLLFKSLFSFCLKKIVRSIIVKGGVSRGCQRLKRLQQTSRSLITISHFDSHCYKFFALKIFSILSKC